jgi:hypothetical protein
MESGSCPNRPHPAGEAVFTRSCWPVDTPGGRYYAELDDDAPVTREGQLIFFAQFLQTGMRWDRMVNNCPLRYFSNRGSNVIDVVGTAVLSVLCGHWRYAHINSVRGDKLNPQLLGMTTTVSEDVIRRAMKRMDEAEGLGWLSREIKACMEPVLSLGWVLDIDSTVKPVYGHQQGAEIGYNPRKLGRPSHCYHSYFMANTRMCLGVEVLSGKEHSGRHGLPGLWKILEGLPRTRWPSIVRGDCSYGNEVILLEAEARGLPYIFKLRQSPRVKDLIARMQHSGAQWKDSSDGWQVMESSLKLDTWEKCRRVVLVRESPAIAPVGENGRRRRDSMRRLPGSEQWDTEPAPWAGKIAVLVSDLDPVAYPPEAVALIYRQRADAENIYDELKNQWGWGGYTTQSLAPSRIMANLIALVYNWWHLYVRLFDAEHHREAITSRPALLGGVARMVRHSGQNTVKVSLQHEKSEQIGRAITLMSNTLHRFNSIAERWSSEQKWALLLTHIFRNWVGGKHLMDLPPEAELALSG